MLPLSSVVQLLHDFGAMETQSDENSREKDESSFPARQLIPDADNIHLPTETFSYADDALFASATGKPCSAACSSEVLSARSSSPSSLNVMPSGIGVVKVPFGP